MSGWVTEVGRWLRAVRVALVFAVVVVLALPGGAAASSYSDDVLAEPSLSGYWRLGETFGTLAVAAKGPDGTYSGSPALGAPSILRSDPNAAVQLDRIDDHVRVPDGAGTDAGSRMTVEAWVRPETATGMQLLTKAGAYQLNLTDTGRWYFEVTIGGQERWVHGWAEPPVVVGEPVHVAATYDGSALRLYVDGHLADQQPASGPVDDVAQDLFLGAWSGGGSWHGGLDEVALYKDALSVGALRRHYEIGSDGTPPAAPAELSASAGDGLVHVDWPTSPEADVDRYDVLRRPSAGGQYTALPTAPVRESRYVDTTAANGTSYDYAVRAVDRAGNVSALSTSASATPRSSLAYREAVLGDQALKGYWRFGDTTGSTAAAAKGPNGLYVGPPELGVAGLLGSDGDKAADFDGANDHVRIEDGPVAELGSSYAVEVWARPDTVDRGMQLVTKPGAFQLQLTAARRWYAGVWTGGDEEPLHNGAQPQVMAGERTHLVLTSDGTEMRLYADGVLLDSAPSVGAVDDVADALYAGAWSGDGSWDGVIDELAIYGRGLSPAEVRDHFELGEDSAAPQAPSRLQASAGDARVSLDWASNPEADVAGYDVLRSSTAGGPHTQLNGAPLTASRFVDEHAVNGSRYFYAVRAIDRAGLRSATSSEVDALPSIPSAYRDAVAGSPSLQGYWRFSDATSERAAAVHGADGSYLAGALPGARGLLADDSDRAVDLDGDRQKAAVADSDALDAASEFTLEAWVRPDALHPRRQYVLSKISSYWLGIDPDGRWVAGFYGSKGWKELFAPTGPAVGSTYHVATTYDGTALRLFVNGTQIAVRQTADTILSSKYDLNIGGWNANEGFDGVIDEPAVYDGALSAAELERHYEIGAAGTPPTAPVGLTAAPSDERVTLTWTPNPEADVEGYDVLRSDVAGGPYTKLNDSPLSTTAYVDKGRTNRTRYFYVVRAINASGDVSVDSAEASATPTAPTRYRDTVAGRPDLAGYWRLDEPSGSRAAAVKGPDGTYNGGPRLAQPGLLRSDDNAAAGFGQLRQNVGVDDSSGDFGMRSSGTLEAWVNLDRIPTTGEFAMGKENTFHLGVAGGGQPEFLIVSGGVWRKLQGPQPLVAGRTYHLVATHDATSQRLYVDGVQVASRTATLTTDAAALPLRIGSRDHYWSFPGLVDEPAVYTTALSAAQVREHFDLGSDATGPAVPATLRADGSNARVTLDWAPVSDADLAGYDVFRSTSSGGPFSKQNPSPVSVSTWVDDDVRNGTTYFYVVRAVDRAGNRGGASTEARATPTSAPELFEPDTLRANGATLRWTTFEQTANGTFRSYEVHRSSQAGFTPSDATRIATIADRETTTYRDTTAAPSRTFTYKLLANGVSSGERTVALPADGQARKTLQPRPVDGRAAYLRAGRCANRGGDAALRVGRASGDSVRGLLQFDLRDVPAGAQVTAANLSLYLRTPPVAAMTVDVHRATAEWVEGSGRGTCSGDGASWSTSDGATGWASPGGDFVATRSAQRVHAADDAPAWDDFDVTGAVQTWARGDTPNHGLILKAADETVDTALATYASDDAAEPSLRPKLSVTYSDGSRALGPEVAVTAPATGARLRGTVAIEVAATDDRRVDKVQYAIDGTPIATDTSAPFTHEWNTTTVANGEHRVTAIATDDAGNETTSAAQTVTVHNSAPPTVTATAPSNRYQQTVLNDTPSAYWRLGETSGTTAGDASGNARNVTLSGTYLLSQPGLLTGDTNTAVRFRNATTDGAVTVTGFGGQLGTQVTAEALVDYAALTTSNAHNRIISRGWGSAGGWMLSVYRDSSNLQRAYWAINKSGSIQHAQATVTPGKLHLAGTYDGTTLRLYVNGVQAATFATSAAALTTTANVLVGQNVSSDITIDEAAVYSGAPPSATAVAAHADVAAGRPPTVKGTFTAKADAQDDFGVTKVEFFLGDDLVGEDAAAPFSAPVDTLSATAPIYDGDYQLTARAHDASGHVTDSTPVNLKVGNAQGTKYLADFTSTAAPASLTYDDAPGATQEAQPLDVTVTNRSTVTWASTSTVLRPRWIAKDGTMTSAGADVALSANVAPAGQQTRRVTVTAPALGVGVEQADYTLRIDLVDTAAAATFASKGNKPLEHAVGVSRKARIEPGLERYYHYDGEDLGAGMQHLLNVASGNSLVRWTPFASPGRGLSTVVDLTYNSLDDKKKGSPVGNNWSLSMSSLTRLGEALDIHPNKADDLAGRAGKSIELTDGDGTTHRFTGTTAADGTTQWQEPPGVHLYLREFSATDARRKWALTRPDRVTFFYDTEGFPTEVADKNGNRLVFTLEAVPNKEDPHGPSKRVIAVTDAAGNDPTPAPDRSFRLSYYSKDDAKKPQIRGKVKRITDHTGSALDFEYYMDGNLRRIVQRGGTTAGGGETLPDRAFVFTYTTSSGNGPAIPAAADRVDPEPKTSNQSTRLFSVRDPLGRETQFAYLGSGAGNDRWKLASRRDRAGATTSYAYDTTAKRTTVTAPLDRVSRYDWDAQGKVVAIRNPKDEETKVAWTADRHVSKVTEPTGAFSEFAYDPNGQLTDVWNQEREHSQLTYDHLAVDARDTRKHVSQLKTRVMPKGMATADEGDYEWSFFYDEKGNLLRLLDQADEETLVGVDDHGCPETVTDARLKVTTFGACDANGQPTTITDANGHTTSFGHDADGLLRWVQDARQARGSGPDPSKTRSELHYDSFHRLGRQSTPKSTLIEPGVLIWSGAEFDANDNLVKQVGPHYGNEWTPEAGGLTDVTYDEMDRTKTVVGPDRKKDAQGDPILEKTVADYDPAGRVAKVTAPLGVGTTDPDDHATSFRYDELDRVIRQTRWLETTPLHTHSCYDLAGDLRSVTAPKANLESVDCAPGASTPGFTRTFGYDKAHRLISSALPGKPARTQGFDANGNVEKRIDELGHETRIKYNERDLPERIDAPFNGTRRLFTEYEYDEVGNLLREFSPRSFSASGERGNDYVTEYTYDNVGQMIKVALPDDDKTTRSYVHRAYDPNGQPTLISLPSASSEVGQLQDEEKTEVEYLDTGWIHSTTDNANPTVDYDYSAEGWQTSRVPQSGREPESWDYFPDGQLREHTGADEGKVTYEYDLNNNLKTAVDASGATAKDDGAITSKVAYDALDRPDTVTQERITGPDLQTDYSYDLNGNVKTRLENKELSGDDPDPGRLHTFTYDQANWLTTQLDDNGDADTLPDDRKLGVEWFDNGLEQRTTQSRSVGDRDGDREIDYDVKQVTQSAYYDNGLVKSLVTRKDVGGDLLESHDLDFLDADNRFHNGHALKDTFRLRGPKSDAPCREDACSTVYRYDAQERLIEEIRNRANTYKTKFELDAAGNIRRSERDVAPIPPDAVTGVQEIVDSEYQGNKIQKRTVVFTAPGKDPSDPRVEYFHHDPQGNLCGIALGRPATMDDCDWSPEEGRRSGLVASYRYDGLNRLRTLRTFKGDAPDALRPDKDTTWTADALDRTTREVETLASGSVRTTSFSHIGLSGDVAQEIQHQREERDPPGVGDLRFTKSYSYDAFGRRIGLEDRRPDAREPVRDSTYAYDAHGNVSLLINREGVAKAQYGYQAYGEEDTDLSAETGPGGAFTTPEERANDPQNAYRYSAKRFDSGAGDLDMGARRFSPSIGRFIQEDFYGGALANLGLSLDPLASNRYSLAGGNPISHVEVDGHVFRDRGGIGGKRNPNGTPDNDNNPNTGTASRVRRSRGYPTASGDAPLTDTVSSAGRSELIRVRQQWGERPPAAAPAAGPGLRRARIPRNPAAAGIEDRTPSKSNGDAALGHALLDVAGLLPGVGEPADAANCAWHGAEGNTSDATLSCAGAVPGFGMFATGLKFGMKAFDGAKTTSRAPRPPDGVTMSADDALNRADSFLGEQYGEVAPGVYRSADGTRQVRMTDSDLAPSQNHAGAAHLNFEEGRTVVTPSGRQSFRSNPNGNSHVYIDPNDL